MTKIFSAFLISMLMLVSACSLQQWNEKLSTPQDRALAVHAIEAFRSGNLDIVSRSIEPELLVQTRGQLLAAQKVMSAPGRPELLTVNQSSFTSDGKTEETRALNYQYGGGHKWVFVQIVLQETDKGPLIIGWHATPSPIKPTSVGDFSFQGKGLLNYVWILAMMASTATIVAALVLLARSKGIKRRWLWAVGSLFGFCQFTLDWSGGAWAVRPVYFALFASGFVRASPVDPWILSFSLPIVAIIFLIRRKTLLAQKPIQSSS
jgi:hypothetical protein